jgi:putative transposase
MERARFVRELASGEWTMSELCEHHGVSRPIGYKWASRYKADGDDGLKERSRAPRGCPHRTQAKTEELVVLLKKTHGWGARKLHRLLRKQLSPAELPCRSTVFDILKRHGLVKSRRRRQRWQHTRCRSSAHRGSQRGMDRRLHPLQRPVGQLRAAGTL